MYIRETYHLPVKRGTPVAYWGRRGRVTGAKGSYLRIRWKGERRSRLYHPLNDDLRWPWTSPQWREALVGVMT